MSYYHIVCRVERGCPVESPCHGCISFVADAPMVNAATDNLGSLSIYTVGAAIEKMDWEPTTAPYSSSVPAQPVHSPNTQALLTEIDNEFMAWLNEPPTVTDSEPITIPTHNHNYVHDNYTPSYNNPFFDEFHAFHPRDGAQNVDYY